MIDLYISTVIFTILGFIFLVAAAVDLFSQQSIIYDFLSTFFPKIGGNLVEFYFIDRKVPEISRRDTPILFWTGFFLEILMALIFWYLAYATLRPEGFFKDPYIETILAYWYSFLSLARS